MTDKEKERVIPAEMVFGVIYDADGEMFFLQQKDCTYWMEPFRNKYNFFGTGIIPEYREKPFVALKRKLSTEMPNVQDKITDEMRFWKTFRLPWGPSIAGEYDCHVYAMILSNKYEMMDLVDNAGIGGKKRGSQVFVSTDRVEKMIVHKDFMASLDVVMSEFLAEIKTGAEKFREKLAKKRS